MLYVQYGCGLCAPDLWRNFDVSPTLRLQKLPFIGRYFTTKEHPRFPWNVEYGDIVKGLPILHGSCKCIYCSHVLEHLSLSDFRIALGRTFDYLSLGGTFRLVVPDMERLAKEYLESCDSGAVHRLMEDSALGHSIRPRNFIGILKSWIGNSHHLWMWDFKSLTKELSDAGFIEIRRAKFGDSSDELFSLVEESGRWEGCLGIESRKPS